MTATVTLPCQTPGLVQGTQPPWLVCRLVGQVVSASTLCSRKTLTQADRSGGSCGPEPPWGQAGDGRRWTGLSAGDPALGLVGWPPHRDVTASDVSFAVTRAMELLTKELAGCRWVSDPTLTDVGEKSGFLEVHLPSTGPGQASPAPRWPPCPGILCIRGDKLHPEAVEIGEVSRIWKPDVLH